MIICKGSKVTWPWSEANSNMNHDCYLLLDYCSLVLVSSFGFIALLSWSSRTQSQSSGHMPKKKVSTLQIDNAMTWIMETHFLHITTVLYFWIVVSLSPVALARRQNSSSWHVQTKKISSLKIEKKWQESQWHTFGTPQACSTFWLLCPCLGPAQRQNWSSWQMQTKQLAHWRSTKQLQCTWNMELFFLHIASVLLCPCLCL